MDERKASVERLIVDTLLSGRGFDRAHSKREKASINDVSPCSEYTRFTMEGTLKDPFSELAVELDVPALGTLFLNGPLLDPRWSQALGYGMAVIEEDTRVHLYRSGKFVVRRARDREHVEACYRMICDLVRPALVLPDGLVLYEAMAVHRAMKDERLRSSISKVLSWPDGNFEGEQLLEELSEGPDGLRLSLRETIHPPLKALFSRVARGEPLDNGALEEVRQKNLASLKGSMALHRGNGRMMSSSASIHLAADKALDIFKWALPSIRGDTGPLQLTLGLIDGAIRTPGDLSSIDRIYDLGWTKDKAVVGLLTANVLLP